MSPIPTAVPDALRSRRNWLVWRLVQTADNKGHKKLPFYANGAPRSGTQGSDEDRAQLATFEEAREAAERGAYSGVGFAILPDTGIVALDFDHCVVDGAIDPAVASLCDGTYTEFSPSGRGIRAFFLGCIMSRKDTKPGHGDFAVEVFGDSGFVTVTGNTTDTCRLFGWDAIVATITPAVLDMYRRRGWDPMERRDQVGGGDLLRLEPTLGWTLAEARDILFACDPAAPRELWLHALMALHHEFSGSPDALNLADEWSAQAPNYAGRADVEGRWRSFGRNSQSTLTGKWLKKWRDECVARRKYAAVDAWKSQIKDCRDEFELRERLCPRMRRDATLDDLAREALAQATFEQLKQLGSKYPVGQCRKLVAPVESRHADGCDLPAWLTGWVYVTDSDKFYRHDSEEWLTAQAFNMRFATVVPEGQAAAAFAASIGIPTVTRGVYLPWAGPTFELHGVSCVNTFRPSTMPIPPAELGPGGRRAAALLTQHIEMLCGGRQAVSRMLLAWMAHNVQHPGVKIRWAPLIKGIPGDGKTLIGNAMGMALGLPNVKQISPKVLGTDFSDWAHGACVGVLEEMKLTGHNRHDIFNALKPNVTNDVIPIHPKGKAEYNVQNTMNYIGFTNHGDALPLDDTDRRWMIVFTPFNTKAELATETRKLGYSEPAAYFDELFEAIASNPGELRRWLLDMPLADNFRPNGNAPHTDEKAHMVSMSASAEETLVRELIEDGARGVSADVLSSKALVEAAYVLDPQAADGLKTNTLNRLLQRLGWRLVARVKWRGEPHRVWVRSAQVPDDTDSLRAALDGTLGAGAANAEAAAPSMF